MQLTRRSLHNETIRKAAKCNKISGIYLEKEERKKVYNEQAPFQFPKSFGTTLKINSNCIYLWHHTSEKCIPNTHSKLLIYILLILQYIKRCFKSFRNYPTKYLRDFIDFSCFRIAKLRRFCSQNSKP